MPIPIDATLPLLSLLLSVTAAMLLGATVLGRARRWRLQRRLLRVRTAGADTAVPERAGPELQLRRQAGRGLLARTSLLLPSLGRVRALLEQAGLELSPLDAIARWFGLSLLLAVLAMLVRGPSPVPALAGFAAGCLLTFAGLGWRIGKRRRTFMAEFPDVLDHVVRSIRSGQPVAEAIQLVARERGGIGREPFRVMAGNMLLGMSLDEALWSATRRLAVAELHYFAISVSVQRETGGNLGEVLQRLSLMLRRKSQIRAKIKAFSSEAKASVIVLGALPLLMLALLSALNPEYMAVLFVDFRGRCLLAAGGASLLVGCGVMARLASFDI